MTPSIIITLIICGTVLLIAAGILISIWRDGVDADTLRKAKNRAAVEDYMTQRRQDQQQLAGKTNV